MFAKYLIISGWYGCAKKWGSVESVERVWNISPKSCGTLLGNGDLAQGEGAVEWALYSKEVLTLTSVHEVLIKNTEVAEDYRLYFLILL